MTIESSDKGRIKPARIKVYFDGGESVRQSFLRRVYSRDDVVRVYQSPSSWIFSPDKITVHADPRTCAEYIVDEHPFGWRGERFEKCSSFPNQKQRKSWPKGLGEIEKIHCLNGLGEDLQERETSNSNNRFHYVEAVEVLSKVRASKKGAKRLIRAHGNTIELMYVPADFN